MEFKLINDRLIVSCTLKRGFRDVIKKTKSQGYNLKKIFLIKDDTLISYNSEDDEEGSICFVIGVLEGNYIKLIREVFGIEHDFYFIKDFKFYEEIFIAKQNINIMKKIDEIVSNDIYIGKENNHENEIPQELFYSLVENFPNRTELIKYSHKRIASILKEFLPGIDKYEKIFDSYISNKDKKIVVDNMLNNHLDVNKQIEIEQFTIAYDELKFMMNHMEGYSEKHWQVKIHKIIQLLYPKYILYARELSFKGIEKYDKRPDFVLVDANGFIDILEIKKPDVGILTVNPSYRHNYIPVRELSGSIQQIEKYIYCLNNLNNQNNLFFDKLRKFLPKKVVPRVLNPQGLLILGRSINFNDQQLRDFELIKRQYKNIAEIITYDDLMFRIENIIEALKR